MSFIAVAIGGAALVGGAMQGQAAKSAANRAASAQNSAALSANELQKYQFDKQMSQQQPWMEAGRSALQRLSGETLDSDKLSRGFTMEDFQKDPGYDFRMQEGQKALERSASARGGLMGAGTLKALSRYGQDFASNEYNNAYNRFKNDQTQRFNQLSSLAGTGQTAVNQVGQASQNYANNASQNLMGAGNAQAAAQIARGNANSQMIGNVANAGMMAYMFSDERLKENIEPVSPQDLIEIKEKVRAYKFNYKNEKHGLGDFVGIMAQELQNTRLGKTLVEKDANGFLQINTHKLLSLLLATLTVEA